MLTDMNPHNNDPSDPNGSGGFGGFGGPPAQPCGKDPSDIMKKATELLINYNERFATANPTLFRDAVIQQTIACLIGKTKPNAILVGAAGVGKTRIAEDIARRLATNDPLIPKSLRGHTMWELPISNIVCGSNYVGDVEAKAKAVIDFASDKNNKVILFIDEIHLLSDAAHKEYSKIAQILKPALARGDIHTLGATTLQEIQNFMDDPALNRRFTRIIVDELSQEQTCTILSQIAPSLVKHYNGEIDINDRTIQCTAEIADTFKPAGSHRPDNAISLLDRTMADALVKRHALIEQATRDGDTALLNSLPPTTLVSKRQLTEVAMKLMTGSNEPITIDFKHLVKELSVIKGQNEPLDAVIDTVQRHQFKLFKSTKPLTFLFAGNSGVGKTEAAKILSRHLTANAPIILNMTEYKSDAAINRIIGAPAGYVGYDSKGELPFDILESNPNRVVLLDEFEKANKSVQRLFMSAFEEGYITTSRGKTIDFSRTIIIATTNAGCAETSANGIGFTQNEPTVRGESYVRLLSKYFDPELINRFKKILQFKPITRELFETILADKYKRTAKDVKAANPRYSFIADKLSSDEIKTLTDKHYNTLFGARHVSDIVQTYIEDSIVQNTTPLVCMANACDDDEDTSADNVNDDAFTDDMIKTAEGTTTEPGEN